MHSKKLDFKWIRNPNSERTRKNGRIELKSTWSNGNASKKKIVLLRNWLRTYAKINCRNGGNCRRTWNELKLRITRMWRN